MKIEYWTRSEINEDGTMGNPVQPERGSVDVTPRMNTSGMHHMQTRSTKRDGLWLSVSTGRLPDGTMHGITIYFCDEAEMSAFEQTRKSIFSANTVISLAGVDSETDTQPAVSLPSPCSRLVLQRRYKPNYGIPKSWTEWHDHPEPHQIAWDKGQFATLEENMKAACKGYYALGQGCEFRMVRRTDETIWEYSSNTKPINEIRAKILAVVDEKHGAFWGEFYDALIPAHTVEDVRLALNSLIQDRTLRMKEDSTEHDWEYRRNR